MTRRHRNPAARGGCGSLLGGVVATVTLTQESMTAPMSMGGLVTTAQSALSRRRLSTKSGGRLYCKSKDHLAPLNHTSRTCSS